MKKFTTRTTIITLTVILAMPLAAMAADDGWEVLFDGKDLSNWKIPEGDNGHWKIVDGVIDYDAQSEAEGDKNLWTKESYGDFTLKIDWRIKQTTGLYNMPTVLPDGTYLLDEDGKKVVTPTPNADSGVFLRGASKAQINI